MVSILIASVTSLLGAFLALFVFFQWKNKPDPWGERQWYAPLQEVTLRVEVMETRWKRVLEELDERIERGNDAWRRYRSAESARVRRAQRKEDEGGELEDETQGVLQLDASASDPRGLSYMPEGMGEGAEPTWRKFGRELAATIANGGN